MSKLKAFLLTILILIDLELLIPLSFNEPQGFSWKANVHSRGDYYLVISLDREGYRIDKRLDTWGNITFIGGINSYLGINGFYSYSVSGKGRGGLYIYDEQLSTYTFYSFSLSNPIVKTDWSVRSSYPYQINSTYEILGAGELTLGINIGNPAGEVNYFEEHVLSGNVSCYLITAVKGSLHTSAILPYAPPLP